MMRGWRKVVVIILVWRVIAIVITIMMMNMRTTTTKCQTTRCYKQKRSTKAWGTVSQRCCTSPPIKRANPLITTNHPNTTNNKNKNPAPSATSRSKSPKPSSSCLVFTPTIQSVLASGFKPTIDVLCASLRWSDLMLYFLFINIGGQL